LEKALAGGSATPWMRSELCWTGDGPPSARLVEISGCAWAACGSGPGAISFLEVVVGGGPAAITAGNGEAGAADGVVALDLARDGTGSRRFTVTADSGEGP
jgi:hypothetical protein